MGKSSFLQEFKAFAMKGNVIDMAVGVIIGGAFGKMGDEACRSSGWQGDSRCNTELRKFPASHFRLSHYRFFYLYVY